MNEKQLHTVYTAVSCPSMRKCEYYAIGGICATDAHNQWDLLLFRQTHKVFHFELVLIQSGSVRCQFSMGLRMKFSMREISE